MKREASKTREVLREPPLNYRASWARRARPARGANAGPPPPRAAKLGHRARLELIRVLLGLAAAVSPCPQVFVLGVLIAEERLDHEGDIGIVLDEVFCKRRG